MHMTYLDSSSAEQKREALRILDDGQIRLFSYEDIMNHHGGAMPAGVALAFRLLQLVFLAYETAYGSPPQRGNAAFYSGLEHNGKGILDTAEYVLGITAERDFPAFARCAAIAAPDAPGGGKYYFEGTLGTLSWKARVKDGIIGTEFFEESKKMHKMLDTHQMVTEHDRTLLMRLRRETETAILSLRPEQLFDWNNGAIPGWII